MVVGDYVRNGLFSDKLGYPLNMWLGVAALISVDACPFLTFPDLTCHLEDTGIGLFWLHCAA